MLVEGALRRQVPLASAQRGDEYFARGRVREVTPYRDRGFSARVTGTRDYHVTCSARGDTLVASCECPWYSQQADICKHIWAAVRAAAARQLLPAGIRYLESQAVVGSDEEREGWESFLDALPAATVRRAPPTHVPDEIAYVLGMYPGTITIQIQERNRKKNGEWSKWKRIMMRTEDLEALPPFDREHIALLNQRAYVVAIESTIAIPPTTAAWWIERLAHAGRLYRANRDNGELEPIRWDDGPPWTLRIAVVNDPAREVYRIDAVLQREGETLPLDDVQTTTHGILFRNGVAARFDDGGRAAWLNALRVNAPVEVPHKDVERFRDALLRTPLADLSLPPELGWDVVDIRPKPLFALGHEPGHAELHGSLFFLYGDWQVSSRSAEMQKTLGRTLIRRDVEAENTLSARLTSLPIVGDAYGYRIRLMHLDAIIRALTTDGWEIRIDTQPVRVAEELDVEISSGIDWFDLNASATFGDVRLTLPELLEAAESRRSLMRLKDGSFGVVPVAWAEALAPVLELGKREGDAVRFRPSQALLVDAMLQTKPKADPSFAELRARLGDAMPEPMQEPPTLTAELRPYQRAGLGWLHFLRNVGAGGCLADDMGLGKTVQTLALLESLRAQGSDRPSLVVAPRSLLFNWAAEAQRFAPELRVREHHGADREKTLEALTECDLVLTTYATMRLDVALLSAIEFEYVILDEAQAIKNASSQVAKASRLLRGRHRLALSGTPIENHLGELWSLFEFLDPGLLGSSRSFQRTFAAKTAPPERREALARALRPLILRRTKQQVAPELPERIEQTLYCELEGKQKAQYEELRDHYRNALLGRVRKGGMDKSRMQILEALLRLRQAACDPRLIDPESDAPSAKTDLLFEELREVLDSGHRALVFSQFTSFLAIVRQKLEKEGLAYSYLDGQTRDRQSLVEQFQTEDGPPLFLISLKAGGLGLNLTNADYIFLLDPWWNPAVEAQAIDRAHRIGRVNPVVAYRLIARDTVEEKILELQARKRELAESIISEDNSVLRRLELEDLELLLS